jgi:hypothetical protein
MGVKGSWQRPKQVDEQTYNDNWDKIFGRKKEPEPKERECNPDPRAPHGFDRNMSHTEDRYVCECEYWTPEKEEADEQ